jgi:hypothetical protein
VLFETTPFVLGSSPGGSITIAGDDLVEVFVNGVLVGTTGSVTSYSAASNGQSRVAVFDLTATLQPGDNVIAVAAQNGPSTFGNVCPTSGCNYSENPAGVAFSGTLTWLN